MSPAQWLIALVGLCLSGATFALMRFPRTRREQYRGKAFSVLVSLAGATIVLVFSLLMVWAQGRFESR